MRAPQYNTDTTAKLMLVALSFGSIPIEVPAWPGTVEVGTSVAREGERVGRTCLLEPAEGLVIRLD